MSAKKNRTPGPTPSPAAQPAVATASASSSPAAAPPASAPWLESADPRKRLVGKVVLCALWIYVAALWLLALDQWFKWGIFGPKVPPV